MRRLPRLAAIAAVCATVAVTHAARAQEPWRALVGCYREKEGLFALDSVPFVGVFANEDGARLVRSGHRWADDLEKMWRMPTPDSVRIRFEGGMYGWTYHLAVRDSALVGVVTTVTDVVLPGGRYPRPERVRAVRVPCPPDSEMSNPRPDSATLFALYGYTALRPTRAQLEADPWGAVAPLQAWLAAHPEAAARWDLKYNARWLFDLAASLDVRAHALELTGTYRLEIERTGGSPYVFHGRTEVRPTHALFADTMGRYLRAPLGYHLRFTLSLDSATLPKPGPGRRHPRAYGSRDAANSEITVHLPGTDAPDGTRRFRASVSVGNFVSAFDGVDRLLEDWEVQSKYGPARARAVYDDAEFVLWPDGRLTFTQRTTVSPDQVVTLRGERISRDAWECAGDRC